MELIKACLHNLFYVIDQYDFLGTYFIFNNSYITILTFFILHKIVIINSFLY